ncbi:MAG TPA: hypothetical protein VGO31_03090 [Microbacteriaceae bacterium]|jgi:hypothetical protein|nr:hypothetical protein [Microbacteriaceae bacterium]
MSRNRTIQLLATVIALGLGIWLGRVLGTWLGLVGFMAVLALGYYLTAPTRRDMPTQAPLSDRNKRLANWCSWGVGMSVLGLAVSYVSHVAGGVVIVAGCVVIGTGILITVVSSFR